MFSRSSLQVNESVAVIFLHWADSQHPEPHAHASESCFPAVHQRRELGAAAGQQQVPELDHTGQTGVRHRHGSVLPALQGHLSQRPHLQGSAPTPVTRRRNTPDPSRDRQGRRSDAPPTQFTLSSFPSEIQQCASLSRDEACRRTACFPQRSNAKPQNKNRSPSCAPELLTSRMRIKTERQISPDRIGDGRKGRT